MNIADYAQYWSAKHTDVIDALLASGARGRPDGDGWRFWQWSGADCTHNPDLTPPFKISPSTGGGTNAICFGCGGRKIWTDVGRRLNWPSAGKPMNERYEWNVGGRKINRPRRGERRLVKCSECGVEFEASRPGDELCAECQNRIPF